ncbi:MAG: hypothetical protein EOP45_11810 [Sphingobacteriaceae bacterium]|nr:MAG: hypothetical protein EOP45_11810 [Sphingobacteriaceae bacterium]
MNRPNTTMKRALTYLTTVFLLNSCISSSKGWQGSSYKNSTHAEFKELNGKQSFKLTVPNDDTYLKYRISVNRGELKAVIKSNSKYILDKTITELEDGSASVVNQKGTEYTFYVDGLHASGSFDIRFTSDSK